MKAPRHVRLVILLFLTIGYEAAQGQPFAGGRWSHSLIPVDSIIPMKLVAVDSEHCIFIGYRYWNKYDHTSSSPYTETKYYYYLTTNGGKSWENMSLEERFNIVERPRFTAGHYHPVVSPLHIDDCISVDGKYVYFSAYGLQGNNPMGAATQRPYDYRLFLSSDRGKNWETVLSAPHPDNQLSSPMLASVPARNAPFLTGFDSLAHFIRSSQSYGSTFSTMQRKQDFLSAVLLTDRDNNTVRPPILQLVHSDLLNLTIKLTGFSNRYIDGTTELFYPDLATLVSSNGGGSWSLHRYTFTGFENEITMGHLEYCEGTPSLYYFPFSSGSNNTSTPFPHKYEGAASSYWSGSKPGDYVKTYFNVTDSYMDMSYLFSDDYGKTWRPEYSFGKRRRAFDVVKDNEVWMTVSRQDSIYFLDSKASVIVRTTNNGFSWEADSLTLFYLENLLDGRIISSVNKHVWIAATEGDFTTHIFRYQPIPTESVEMTEGAPSILRDRMKAYPNPAAVEINISSPYRSNILKIEVYDMMGRVMHQPITIQDDTCNVDTRSLSNGCYLVVLTTDKGNRYNTRITVLR